MNQPSKSVLLMLLCQAAAFPLNVRADTDKSVTAAQVNGTWKTKSGEFKIWARGKQRPRSNFRAFTNTKRRRAEWRMRAKAAASRALKAIPPFKPEGAEAECRITLKFTGGKLVVTQTAFADSATT